MLDRDGGILKKYVDDVISFLSVTEFPVYASIVCVGAVATFYTLLVSHLEFQKNINMPCLFQY